MSKEELVELCFFNTPSITLLDPMNIQCVQEHIIYHDRILQIQNKSYHLNVSNVKVMTSFLDSIWKVDSVFLHIKRKNVIKSKIVTFETKDIRLHWMVKDIIIKNNRIIKILLY